MASSTSKGASEVNGGTEEVDGGADLGGQRWRRWRIEYKVSPANQHGCLDLCRGFEDAP